MWEEKITVLSTENEGFAAWEFHTLLHQEIYLSKSFQLLEPAIYMHIHTTE